VYAGDVLPPDRAQAFLREYHVSQARDHTNNSVVWMADPGLKTLSALFDIPVDK